MPVDAPDGYNPRMRLTAVAILSIVAALALCACPEAKQPGATAVMSSSQMRGSVHQGAKATTLNTSDGWKIAAWYWPPPSANAKAPGVILLHQRAKDKGSWGSLPAQLVKQGYAVIAIDLRGHGESVGPG